MALTNKTVNIAGRSYFMRTSKATLNESPVHISDSMTGKMSGIPAISTSCVCNPICQKRMANPKMICAECFARATIDRYDNTAAALESNYYLLNESILSDDMLPVFGNVRFVRIESFGDLASVNQAVNYIHIANANPDVTFAWWTKNPRFINVAMLITGRPENVIFIESSPYINKQAKKSYDWIDKIFTVYDAETIQEKRIDINCGARCCMTCRRCYSKSNTETIVNEKLK